MGWEENMFLGNCKAQLLKELGISYGTPSDERMVVPRSASLRNEDIVAEYIACYIYTTLN